MTTTFRTSRIAEQPPTSEDYEAAVTDWYDLLTAEGYDPAGTPTTTIELVSAPDPDLDGYPVVLPVASVRLVTIGSAKPQPVRLVTLTGGDLDMLRVEVRPQTALLAALDRFQEGDDPAATLTDPDGNRFVKVWYYPDTLTNPVWTIHRAPPEGYSE